MYKTPDMSLWQGRIDGDRQAGDSRRWHQCVRPYEDQADSGVALLGVVSDEGVRRNQGRPGATAGPDAIRRALANQAFHLDRPVYDAGQVLCEGSRLEEMQQEQARMVQTLLAGGHFPLLLGGGHEIALGSFSGLQQYLIQTGDQSHIGIINFDAHFDLRREDVSTSGTPFLQIADLCRRNRRPFHYLCLGISESANTAALFAQAESLGVEYVKDEEISRLGVEELDQKIDDFVAPCGAVYLSIDLDVLPAATAPGVSAPAARGVLLAELEQLLLVVRAKAGTKLKLADLAEYNPAYDIDSRTAKVAARLCHVLLRPQLY